MDIFPKESRVFLHREKGGRVAAVWVPRDLFYEILENNNKKINTFSLGLVAKNSPNGLEMREYWIASVLGYSDFNHFLKVPVHPVS